MNGLDSWREMSASCWRNPTDPRSKIFITSNPSDKEYFKDLYSAAAGSEGPTIKLKEEEETMIKYQVVIQGNTWDIPNTNVSKARDQMMLLADKLATLKAHRKSTKKTLGYLPEAIKVDFAKKIEDLETAIQTLDDITETPTTTTEVVLLRGIKE